MPEPEPDSWPLLTSILTTDGSTSWATCSTVPSAAAWSGVSTTCDVVRRGGGRAGRLVGCHASHAAAPPTPAAPPTSSEVATTAAANVAGPPDRGGRASAGGGPARGAVGCSPYGVGVVLPVARTRGGRGVGHGLEDVRCSCDDPETALCGGEEVAACGALRCRARVGSVTITGMTAPEPRFVDDRLAHWAAETPDAEAITYAAGPGPGPSGTTGYAAPRAACRALGIGRGDVVSFLDKNHPACVEISLAAGSLGAANAIINWRLAGDEVDYAVNDSGARVLFVGTELMPLVDKIRDRLPAVERSSR